jgi:hypothetical protein
VLLERASPTTNTEVLRVEAKADILRLAELCFALNYFEKQNSHPTVCLSPRVEQVNLLFTAQRHTALRRLSTNNSNNNTDNTIQYNPIEYRPNTTTTST